MADGIFENERVTTVVTHPNWGAIWAAFLPSLPFGRYLVCWAWLFSRVLRTPVQLTRSREWASESPYGPWFLPSLPCSSLGLSPASWQALVMRVLQCSTA